MAPQPFAAHANGIGELSLFSQLLGELSEKPGRRLLLETPGQLFDS
jgi:hypothetical protein